MLWISSQPQLKICRQVVLNELSVGYIIGWGVQMLNSDLMMTPLF